MEVFGLDVAISRLPPSLRARVVGATYGSETGHEGHMKRQTRFRQILAYVERHHISSWLAVDDDPYGWSDDYYDNLVLCNVFAGLSDVSVLMSLRDKLRKLTCLKAP